MQAIYPEVKEEHTILTEQDLTLQLTKDEIWNQKMKLNESSLCHDAVKQEENAIKDLHFDISYPEDDYLNHSNTFQSVDAASLALALNSKRQTKQYTPHLSDPKNSNQVNQEKKDVRLKDIERQSVLTISQSFPSVSKEVNISREPKQVLFNEEHSNFVKQEIAQDEEKQHQLRTRLREIDYQMRELNVQKNRLKYFLRKQKNMVLELDEDSFQTRECPCCGKLISKLCFKCQHIYCNVDNCPRKKKQKLNAKMLEKMRQKKKGDGRKRRFTRSRDKDRSKKQQIDKNAKDLSSLSSDQLSFTDRDQNDYTESELVLKDEPQKVYETRNRVKKTPDWMKTITMSDISLKESKLFMSSMEQDNP